MDAEGTILALFYVLFRHLPGGRIIATEALSWDIRSSCSNLVPHVPKYLTSTSC